MNYDPPVHWRSLSGNDFSFGTWQSEKNSIIVPVTFGQVFRKPHISCELS